MKMNDTGHTENAKVKAKEANAGGANEPGESGTSSTPSVSDSNPSPATAPRELIAPVMTTITTTTEPPASPSRQTISAQRISQFDATSPSGRPPAAPRRFGSTGNASLNAPSSRQSKFCNPV